MKTKKNLLLLLLLLVLPFTLQAETFNVKKYGARGNGKKMDSPAIHHNLKSRHGLGEIHFRPDRISREPQKSRTVDRVKHKNTCQSNDINSIPHFLETGQRSVGFLPLKWDFYGFWVKKG